MFRPQMILNNQVSRVFQKHCSNMYFIGSIFSLVADWWATVFTKCSNLESIFILNWTGFSAFNNIIFFINHNKNHKWSPTGFSAVQTMASSNSTPCVYYFKLDVAAETVSLVFVIFQFFLSFYFLRWNNLHENNIASHAVQIQYKELSHRRFPKDPIPVAGELRLHTQIHPPTNKKPHECGARCISFY